MTLKAPVLDQAKSLQSELVELRRHIHQHPELSFAELETAKLAAEKLKDMGFAVKTAVGKTGVVGDLGSGRTIAIRADMDALPIDEVNQVAYRSQNPGVMHACGHDAHVACALTAAKILSSLIRINPHGSMQRLPSNSVAAYLAWLFRISMFQHRFIKAKTGSDRSSPPKTSRSCAQWECLGQTCMYVHDHKKLQREQDSSCV